MLLSFIYFTLIVVIPVVLLLFSFGVVMIGNVSMLHDFASLVWYIPKFVNATNRLSLHESCFQVNSFLFHF